MKKVITLLFVIGIAGFVNMASAQDSARNHKQPMLTPQEQQHVKDAKATVDALSPKEKKALRHQLRNAQREEWNKLSPEKKQELKDKMKAKWESYTPMEKMAFKENMKAAFKAKWNNMSPEKRRRFMHRLNAHSQHHQEDKDSSDKGN